jgi:hypothetical protein
VVKAINLGAWTLLTVALSAACSQVLDIQDARVDSTLRAGSGGAAGSSEAPVGGKAPSAIGGDESSAGDDSVAGSGNNTGNGGSSSEPSGGKAGNSGSSSTTGGDGEDMPPAASLCESYCDTVMTNCKGKYEQYRTFDQCVEVCKRMPPGEPGDDNVNSVECRLTQAKAAAAEGFLYCKSAGPLGAGRCGSNCVSYCALMQATCTPESTAQNLEPSYYEDSQACLEACGAIPAHEDDPTQYSSSATAEPSCYVGNTVYCRAYHITSALEQDAADEHCPHAMGGDPCIDQ